MRRPFPCLLPLLLLTGRSCPVAISATPPRTAAIWLTIQPHAAIRIGAHEIILVQPSTTLFVYILHVPDHVLVAKKGYFSFREAGLIP